MQQPAVNHHDVCTNMLQQPELPIQHPSMTLTPSLDATSDLTLHCSRQAGSTMSEADVATILRSVLRFIAQCHTKGIIYRDVKPDNFLFLTSDATTVKATDFGLSIRSAMLLWFSNHPQYSPQSMAIEVFAGAVKLVHVMDCMCRLRLWHLKCISKRAASAGIPGA